MKKDFDDCLDLLPDKKIREFVQQALRQADPKFWKSHSGSHHPDENNFKGGLIIHSRKAVKVAVNLFGLFDINDRLAQQKIIAACILHDLCKGGEPWGEKFDLQHAKVAERKLKSKIIDNDKDLVDIADLVGAHMGKWGEPVPIPALFVGQTCSEKDVWRLIVQLSDFWASRKWCSFVADVILD